MAREAGLQLEELQHQGEPEARWPLLVGDQRPVPVHKDPAGDWVLGFPLPPHGVPDRHERLRMRTNDSEIPPRSDARATRLRDASLRHMARTRALGRPGYHDQFL